MGLAEVLSGEGGVVDMPRTLLQDNARTHPTTHRRHFVICRSTCAP